MRLKQWLHGQSDAIKGPASHLYVVYVVLERINRKQNNSIDKVQK